MGYIIVWGVYRYVRGMGYIIIWGLIIVCHRDEDNVCNAD